LKQPILMTLAMESDKKRIVLEFFDLVSSGSFKEGLHFFKPDCITHNPYFAGGIVALIDAMTAANKEMAPKYPNAGFAVKHVLVDGNLVAVYTQLLNNRSDPNNGGLRQAHLFRFEGDKIAEYWDITQLITPDMPNAMRAF
jgi:predicted SnoaL-like aldol condensation-catalyzing enzyme